MSSSPKKWGWFALRLILLVVILVFLGQSIATHWTTVQRSAENLNWGRFTLSVLLFILVLALMPLATFVALRALSDRVRFREASAMFFASQAAKYLPGGMWTVPGRVLLYQQRLSIPAIQGSISVLWEVFTLALAALIVGMSGASLPDNKTLLPVWMLLALVGVVIGLVGLQTVLSGRLNHGKILC